MRHIAIDTLLQEIFAGQDGQSAKRKLEHAHITASKKPTPERKAYIDKNGPTKWTPVKDRFTAILGNKCWYTEAELVGASLSIDHYRPKTLYWFLAFDPRNFRVACPYVNSPKNNPLYEGPGGKGDNFPLHDTSKRATDNATLQDEHPIILDPCNEDDCDLLAFQADGRPVLNPAHHDDPAAHNRLEKSKLLLNLDHPAFNAKREEINNTIKENVALFEELPVDSPSRPVIAARLIKTISASAPFSVAAKSFLRNYRHLDWVEEILQSHGDAVT